ncbi:hypothetical protein G1L02_08700 [Tenacibaculum finnmarkense]|uniref:hypothetical protein n=1 Tax=Tenacibaculum finnmarkense TaxID=2781243 RepID=UPI00187BC26D|nr:hypothetical protein [Tenacibaculum finnmarkense]MBE7634381.1 hypothetical protein [Tenacibaculum finnmarkense genomovar ulcerans]MCD8430649.1 hypothetical protein [Tenacibaculum finnmarkense genomovar ulcerans]MCD8432941.1 hypothetical protein [Tenacibaculum finnmarkense genomovar ulcerans]MCG8883236.1 hypothetical protein [Tenacibaculum finnmarkense]
MKIKTSFLKCLALTLLLTSCGANKPKIHHLTQAEIKTYRNAQNYTVKLPESWKAVPDHDFVTYTPKNLGAIFYKNTVRIFNVTPKKIGSEKITLQKVTEDYINHHFTQKEVSLQEVTKHQTRFGTTYLQHYKHDWNSVDYDTIRFFFEVKGSYYTFTYSSEEKYQQKYQADADLIFKSLSFK